MRAIDAARGLAMVFVCLSHFSLEYFRRLDRPAIADTLYQVSMVGSPTFILISGAMLGVLYETRPERFRAHRMLLADRALFMLTIGHLLIMVASAPRLNSLAEIVQRGFITDAIAVALLLGPLLVVCTSRGARALLALCLFASAWVIAMHWTPVHGLDRAARYLLVGPYPYDAPHNFPLLPWLAVYLAATVIGQWLGERLARDGGPTVERTLMLWGGAAVGAVALYKMSQHSLRVSAAPSVAVLMSPWRKLPPSPAYLLFYGGCALLLVASAFFVERRKLWGPLFDWLACIGRASLFVFIVQFYLYYVILLMMHLPYTPFWPLIFGISVVGIAVLARHWDDGNMNRYLSVGLPHIRTTRVGRALLASGITRWRPRFLAASASRES